MRGANNKIGFDDRLVMILVIPVLAFIIPIVFMGCRFGRYPLFSWDKYVTTMIIAIYESIYFMNELRKSVEETENLKRESLSAQLNALRTQVNPHFLFNNLNTLCSLIPENPTHAVNFVQELSKVYRHILEVKDEKSILLKDELSVL